MKEVIEKLMLTQINSLLNERKKLATNQNKIAKANNFEENQKRDEITQELTASRLKKKSYSYLKTKTSLIDQLLRKTRLHYFRGHK